MGQAQNMYLNQSKKKVETTLPQRTYSANYKIGVDDTHAF